MVFCERFANIPTDEPFVNGTSCMWFRSSTSLLRVLCGKKENVRSPTSRAPLVVRRPLRVHSHSPTFPGLHCDLHFETQSCFTSLAGRYVSFTDLRSIRPWRIAD